MTDRERTVKLEALSASPTETLERVAGGEVVILTRNGRPVAALLGIEKLGSIQRERELLRRLALGELESAAGEGDDLDAVLDDCRLLLEES